MTKQEPKPAEYFAETSIGAVVLLSIMFLSQAILVGGLGLIGIAKLFSRWRSRTA
jgi:hypothetical protein